MTSIVEKISLQGLELNSHEMHVALEKSFKKLLCLATKMNITLSSCESFTAGLFCSWCGRISGASQVLQGGIVSYQNSIKQQLVHVSERTIETYGVISSQCAQEMAIQTRNLIPSTYCVSFTGNAGPGAMENKQAGLVYMSIACEEKVYSFEALAGETVSRNQIQKAACLTMAQWLCKHLENKLTKVSQ